MRVITAPEVYEPRKDDLRIFLAGGISGCEDWQKDVIEFLRIKCADKPYNDNIVIFNPRRAVFDVTDPNTEEEQIMWEYRNIVDCDLFTIYFCPDQIQPICLFELGKVICTVSPTNLLISVHPNYPRIRDIEIQTACHFGMDLLYLAYDAEEHAINIMDRIEARYFYGRSNLDLERRPINYARNYAREF